MVLIKAQRKGTSWHFQNRLKLAPTVREFATGAGELLHSINEAGYELRRVEQISSDRTWADRFDELVTSEPLRQASGALFRDGHYARAVEEAFKCLNNAVREKSRLTSQDGVSLMQSAFSANKPVLHLNRFQTQSERDEQLGYMNIYAGVMAGIRNPRAHDHQLTDPPEAALEMITLANHLMRKLDAAEAAT